MSIGSTFNVATQVPSRVIINKVTAVQLVGDNDTRTMLRVGLDFPADTVGAIVGPTQALVEELKGELIGQTFEGNDNRFDPAVVFNMDSASQEQKWAILLSGSAAETYEILVNEYIG